MAQCYRNDAVDILCLLGCNFNNHCGFEIHEFLDGRVEATFSWNPTRWSAHAQPPCLDIGYRKPANFNKVTTFNFPGPEKGRRRRRKSPAKRKRDKLRLQTFIAEKKGSHIAKTQTLPISISVTPVVSPTEIGQLGSVTTVTQTDVIVDHSHIECGKVVGTDVSVECDLSINNSVPSPKRVTVLEEQGLGGSHAHTAPTLKDALPCLPLRELCDLMVSVDGALKKKLKEYQVACNLLGCLNSQPNRDNHRLCALLQRTESLEHDLRQLSDQSDLIHAWAHEHLDL